MQNPSNPLSDSHILKNLENIVSTLQDLIQDRRLSLSSRLSPLRPEDLFFIDSSKDDITFICLLEYQGGHQPPYPINV